MQTNTGLTTRVNTKKLLFYYISMQLPMKYTHTNTDTHRARQTNAHQNFCLYCFKVLCAEKFVRSIALRCLSVTEKTS